MRQIPPTARGGHSSGPECGPRPAYEGCEPLLPLRIPQQAGVQLNRFKRQRQDSGKVGIACSEVSQIKARVLEGIHTPGKDWVEKFINIVHTVYIGFDRRSRRWYNNHKTAAAVWLWTAL